MALIPEDIITQIIDRCDIVDIISGYVPLKKAGRNFKANCPFHNEKTPSFVVNPDKQIFHCFGCGVGGNVVSFVMKHEHLEFPEALKLLAQRVHVEIPTSESAQRPNNQLREQIFKINELALQYFHKNLVSGKDASAKQARDYLKDRGVSLETVQQFKLGYAYDEWDGLIKHLQGLGISLSLMEKAGVIIAREGKEGFYDRYRHRIIFPIFDMMGHCRAFGGRALGESNAKYINSPETSAYIKGQHLFGFNFSKSAVGQLDQVIITEGYMDFIMPYQVGIENLAASLGTALTIDQIRLVRRYTKNIIFLYDMDAAGESAMMRSLDMLIEEGMNVKVAYLTQGDDPDSFVRKYGVDDFRKRMNEALPLFDYKLKVLGKQYSVESIEGKAKIAEQMLLTIAKFDNAVIRSGYLSRLSKELNVAEAHLWTEFNKITTKTTGVQKEEVKNIGPSQPLPPRTVERAMLKLLLEDETLIAATKSEISTEDFQDSNIRDVIAHMFDLFDQGKNVNASNLLNRFEDEQISEMISGLATLDGSPNVDKEKMFRDYVKRFKEDRHKAQRKYIHEQLKEAQKINDQDKIDLLLKELNQLIKG